MRDYLNRFDPMPLQLGPVVRQKPEPTAEQKRIAAFREFEAMSDKLKATGAANGDAMVGIKQQPEADSEGWIKWDGNGTVPVEGGALADILLRNGMVLLNQETGPENWVHRWGSSDIVDYRLIQEPKKPEADADGWVAWDASKTGVCPVKADVLCQFRFRQSALSRRPARAGHMYWGETGGMGTIVAYRVIG